MLLPQVPEADIYDSNGNQIDDITSIVELIRVKLGYDKHADDEDSDNGQNFHIVTLDYAIQLFPQKITYYSPAKKKKQSYIENDSKTSSVVNDIIVPPPEA